VKFHGILIACTFLLFSVKQNRWISTFHSTGGALSFLFIVNIVLIGLGLGLALTLVLHDKTPL